MMGNSQLSLSKMDFKIIKQDQNFSLQREEVILEIKSSSNPSFKDVKDYLKKDEKVLVIKEIIGGFGRDTFLSKIFIYNSEEDKKNIETIPKKVRKKLAEEKAKAEKEKKVEEEVKTE